jgi:hypothetical protein
MNPRERLKKKARKKIRRKKGDDRDEPPAKAFHPVHPSSTKRNSPAFGA